MLTILTGAWGCLCKEKDKEIGTVVSQFTRFISGITNSSSSRTTSQVGNSSSTENKGSQKAVSQIASQSVQFMNRAGSRLLTALDVIPKEIMIEREVDLRIIRQPGNGDCLFNSFISGLRLLKDVFGPKWKFGWKSNEEIVPVLRKQVADWIRQNWDDDQVKQALEISVTDFKDQYNQDVTRKLDAGETVSDEDLAKLTVINSMALPDLMKSYTRLIEKKGFFGSNGEILALCRIYDVSALIHCKVGDTYITNPDQQFHLAEDGENRPQIHLEYNPGKRHYSTIVPKEYWESPLLELRKIDPNAKKLTSEELRKLNSLLSQML
ncbi:MAG: hypothetical protein HKM07_07720 [Chlamydiae bacterium]|nr:hypothetical protein [Chlamydiota bacterium]